MPASPVASGQSSTLGGTGGMEKCDIPPRGSHVRASSLGGRVERLESQQTSRPQPALTDGQKLDIAARPCLLRSTRRIIIAAGMLLHSAAGLGLLPLLLPFIVYDSIGIMFRASKTGHMSRAARGCCMWVWSIVLSVILRLGSSCLLLLTSLADVIAAIPASAAQRLMMLSAVEGPVTPPSAEPHESSARIPAYDLVLRANLRIESPLSTVPLVVISSFFTLLAAPAVVIAIVTHGAVIVARSVKYLLLASYAYLRLAYPRSLRPRDSTVTGGTRRSPNRSTPAVVESASSRLLGAWMGRPSEPVPAAASRLHLPSAILNPFWFQETRIPSLYWYKLQQLSLLLPLWRECRRWASQRTWRFTFAAVRDICSSAARGIWNVLAGLTRKQVGQWLNAALFIIKTAALSISVYFFPWVVWSAAFIGLLLHTLAVGWRIALPMSTPAGQGAMQPQRQVHPQRRSATDGGRPSHRWMPSLPDPLPSTPMPVDDPTSPDPGADADRRESSTVRELVFGAVHVRLPLCTMLESCRDLSLLRYQQSTLLLYVIVLLTKVTSIIYSIASLPELRHPFHRDAM